MNSSHSVIVTCNGRSYVENTRASGRIFLIYGLFLRTTAVPFTGYQQGTMLICINYILALRNRRRRCMYPVNHSKILSQDSECPYVFLLPTFLILRNLETSGDCRVSEK